MLNKAKGKETKPASVVTGFGWIKNIFATPKEHTPKNEKLEAAATNFVGDIFELIPEGKHRMKFQELFSECLVAAKNGITLGGAQYGNA